VKLRSAPSWSSLATPSRKNYFSWIRYSFVEVKLCLRVKYKHIHTAVAMSSWRDRKYRPLTHKRNFRSQSGISRNAYRDLLALFAKDLRVALFSGKISELNRFTTLQRLRAPPLIDQRALLASISICNATRLWLVIYPFARDISRLLSLSWMSQHWPTLALWS
jgi:hypothetical protein